MAQISAKRDLLGLWFFPWRKWKCVSEHLVSPDVWNAIKEVYSYLAPSRILKYGVQLGGREGLGRTAVRAYRGFQRNANVTVSWTSSGSLPKRQWGIPYLWIPQLAQSSPMLHIPHPHTFSMWALGAHEDGKYEPLQMASEHTQKASPTLWDWEKARKQAFSPALEKTHSRHLTWVCRIERRHKILRISLLSRRDKKCGTGVSIENVWESLRIPNG